MLDIRVDTFSQQRRYLMQHPEIEGRSLSVDVLDRIGGSISFQLLKKLDLAIQDEREKLLLLPGDEDITNLIEKLRSRKAELLEQVVEILDEIDAEAAVRVKQREQNEEILDNYKREISKVNSIFIESANKNRSEPLANAISAVSTSLGLK